MRRQYLERKGSGWCFRDTTYRLYTCIRGIVSRQSMFRVSPSGWLFAPQRILCWLCRLCWRHPIVLRIEQSITSAFQSILTFDARRPRHCRMAVWTRVVCACQCFCSPLASRLWVYFQCRTVAVRKFALGPLMFVIDSFSFSFNCS